MTLWVYDEKVLTGIPFLFGTLSFTTGEEDDLECSAQD
jgi:hypothetical protein